MSKTVKLGLGFLLAALAAVAATALFLLSLLQPVNSSAAPTRFVVPKGQAISVIANRLHEQNFIKNALVFRALLKYLQLENQIQAGSFKVSGAMTPAEIARTLTQGTDDIWVTIPEGWRIEEIAESLGRQELTEFDQAVFLDLAASSEGKLFPDTYLISRDATAKTVYSILTNTFDKKIVEGLAEELGQAEQAGRSLDQVLTMASLIEREANGAEQMRQISGVLWRRLEIGMPLQVDATLQYAKGYNKAEASWWVPPTIEDKKLNSAFNTYLNPGLPPRPIANPGLDAIRAAADPTPTEYLFYIHDREGQVHFAKTLEQHNANVAKYLR